MSINDLKEQLNRDKLVATRTYPEVGADDGLETLMDVVAVGKKVALVLGADEDSRPAPYRIVPFFLEDVVRSGDKTYISVQAPVGATVWVIRPVEGDEVKRWDAHQDNYDDADEEAVAMATGLLRVLPSPREKSVFDVSRWYRLVGAKLFPAGAMAIEDGQLLVAAIPEFEDEATNWKTRFTRVPKDGLETINEMTDRYEMISAPIKLKAPDVVTALERMRYLMARDHFQQTGKSVFG